MSLTPYFVICGLVCAFWMLVHHFLASRLDAYKLLIALLGAVFFAAAGDILLGSLTGSDTISHLVVLACAPSIIPLTWLYFTKLERPFQPRPIHFIWLLFPAVLLTAGITLVGLNGIYNTDILLERIHSRLMLYPDASYVGLEKTYYIWTVVIFRIIMLLECIFLVVYVAYMSRKKHFKFSDWTGFLLRGYKMRVLEIQMTLSLLIMVGFSVKIFLHVPFYRIHPILTVVIVLVMSVLLFFFGLFALFGSKESISMDDVRSALRFNYSRENQSRVSEEVVMDMVNNLQGQSLTHVISHMVMQTDGEEEPSASQSFGKASLTSALFGNNNQSWDEGTLVYRFQHLMQDELLFLRQGLTLQDVAERLDSNKTYISKMVNQTYGIGFPEVLNIMRVDYAQQYMSSHSDASQEDIAKASGFQSASSFNSTFKRITGYTPKVWASRK